MSISVYDTLSQWARRTSSWAESRFFSPVPEVPEAANGLIYRLRYWPDLPVSMRTANVYRSLSVMSHRPVNRAWLLAHAGLQATQLDRLLRRLQNQEAVEVIDAAQYKQAAYPQSSKRESSAPARAHTPTR